MRLGLIQLLWWPLSSRAIKGEGSMALSGLPNLHSHTLNTTLNLEVRRPKKKGKKKKGKIVVRVWKSLFPTPVVSKWSKILSCPVCMYVCGVGWGGVGGVGVHALQSDPAELILNEINKFRLNWQLASKVIIPSLMSSLWNGKRLGVSGETVGCVQPGFSSTKK